MIKVQQKSTWLFPQRGRSETFLHDQQLHFDRPQTRTVRKFPRNGRKQVMAPVSGATVRVKRALEVIGVFGVRLSLEQARRELEHEPAWRSTTV
jgi:hypothetical protein